MMQPHVFTITFLSGAAFTPCKVFLLKPLLLSVKLSGSQSAMAAFPDIGRCLSDFKGEASDARIKPAGKAGMKRKLPVPAKGFQTVSLKAPACLNPSGRGLFHEHCQGQAASW